MKSLFRTFGWMLFFSAVASAAETNDTGARLATAVREADTITIYYFVKDELRERSVTFTDDVWRERLAFLLATGTYDPRDYCWCVATPRVDMKRKGIRIGSFSVHHREKLRVSMEGLNGDFFVGTPLGTAFVDLANEKKGLLNASADADAAR